MRKTVIIGTACVLGCIVLVATRRTKEGPVRFDSVTVQRGDVTKVLRESAVLSSKNPVLVKNKFYAVLKWIVDDGAWVEKDDTVFTVNAEKTIDEVGRKRLELIAMRQELRLATLRKEHAEETETLKLDAARRQYELAKIRHRILTSQPKGGRALIDIHEELLPLERKNRTMRPNYEGALDGYLAAQDGFFETQDAYESEKNKMLRAQALTDQLTLETERNADVMQPEEKRKHEEALSKLKQAEQDCASSQTNLPLLRVAMTQARGDVRRLVGPLDELKRELDKGEDEVRDLYIRLEIEKRGLTLAKLQLDQEAGKLRLDEAARTVDDAEKSFDSGVISKSTLDDHRNQRRARENELKIIQQKIRIASRPPAPEELEEAKMKLEKARADAESAQQAYDQVIAMKEAKIKVIRARITKFEHEIDYAARNFEELIEANISAAQRELEILDAEDTTRKTELHKEIARLGKQLVSARDNPPHIYKAPVRGLIRLKKYGRSGRPTQAGDEWWEEDAVVMIYPPENLEVLSQINEVNARLVSPGMKVSVLAPSLGGKRFPGEVYQVAGIAKDKFERKTRWFEQKGYAGVTQFDMRIRLKGFHPDLRQGMTLIVEMETERREDVMWLPAGTVEEDTGHYFVRIGSRGDFVRREIQGEYFGADKFVVTGGLTEGDKVWVARKRNI